MKKILLILMLSLSLCAQNFDYLVTKDNKGFWGAHYDVPRYSTYLVLALAAYKGNDDKLGKASWQAIDAGIISQIVTTAIKHTAGRERPRVSGNPNVWGTKNGRSFVSGHVSGMTALVTPYVLEYQNKSLWAHLLWTLPAYQMVGRVKAHAHWQSDVVGAALVGFASGYWAHKRDYPFTLYFVEDNLVLGFESKF